MHATDLRGLAERWIAVRNTARPSPNTVVGRVHDLAVIGDHLAGTDAVSGDRLAVLETLTVDDVELSRLEDAFGDYAGSHAGSSTRRVMSTWRQFCLWLVREKLIVANPMDQIESPARGRWAPKTLQPEDLAAVAEHSSHPAPTTRDPWPERDEALFALLIGAGLRISETIGVHVGDCYLDDDPPRLRIEGKGDKTRGVPIPPEVVTRIRTYLESRTDRHGKPDPATPLMMRPDGRTMSRSAADHAIRGWFRRAGRTPPSGALAHSFRHTYATMLIDNGASLPEVQQLLGHADLATTQAYLAVYGHGLAEAVLANPARRLLTDQPESLARQPEPDDEVVESPGPIPTGITEPSPRPQPKLAVAGQWVVEFQSRHGNRRLVCSTHRTETGATRMVATLTKRWRHRNDRVLDRWNIEHRPSIAGEPVRFDSAAEARAAADLLVFDDGLGRERVVGRQIRSTPLPYRDDIEQPYRHVKIDITNAEGGSSTLSEALRNINGPDRWEIKHPDLPASHDAYIGPIINWLFGYIGPTAGGAHLNSELRPQIGEIIDRLFGDAGTAWELDATELLDAITATGTVIDLTAATGHLLAFHEPPGQ